MYLCDVTKQFTQMNIRKSDQLCNEDKTYPQPVRCNQRCSRPTVACPVGLTSSP